MHGLKANDRDILLISEPDALTVMSFVSPSPSPTTYNMSGAGRRCSCRAAPLRGSAVRSSVVVPSCHLRPPPGAAVGGGPRQSTS